MAVKEAHTHSLSLSLSLSLSHTHTHTHTLLMTLVKKDVLPGNDTTVAVVSFELSFLAVFGFPWLF